MNTVRSLTQAYSQTPWRKQVMVIVLSLLFVVFATLVAGVYLSVTARAATMGREVLLMQEDIDELELVNADLATQLAFITSDLEMAKRADDLGFVPIEKDQSIFVMVPGYVRRGHLKSRPSSRSGDPGCGFHACRLQRVAGRLADAAGLIGW